MPEILQEFHVDTQKHGNYHLFFLPLVLILVLLFLRQIIGSILSILLSSFLKDSNQEFFFNIILNILLILVMLLIIYFLIKKNYLKLNNQIPNKIFRFKSTALGYIISFSLVYIITIIFSLFTINNLPDSSYEEITINSANISPLNVILLFLLLSILAPVFEELLFRRFFIPILEAGYGTFGAIILSSIMFGLIHTENDLSKGNPTFAIIHLVNAFILGLGLGIVYVATRNLIFPIIFHGFNNFFPPFFTQVILAFYDIDPFGSFSQPGYNILVIISFILLLEMFIGLFLLLFIIFKKTNILKYIITQTPAILEKSSKKIVFFGGLLVVIFFSLTVIWPVSLRKFLVETVFHFNNTNTIFFFILTDTVVFFVLVFLIVYYRRLLPNITSKENSIIDMEQFLNQEIQFYTKNEQYEQKIPLYCIYCGQKLLNQAEYCSYCGKRRIPLN